ncbi:MULTISPECIES: TetR family transcriptional regulator [Streptomyces]|uniref:TetR family transcriptional regulator n=1 Tax=Streptomyces venezuelae TaxID=54571 RepID=A0A5P2AKL9_STRVZ|nr:TetR family transcriptional regulator [Streptomyces venezuelae]QES18742.1 TetR family transcriptional regulator [Streptomyces venezuelae]
MSPRGVAIPDIRERLFAAAERVVTRDGPGALTSRAVTNEAGVAKGALHAHFAGLDEFIGELVLDRFASTARQADQLTSLVGQDTVKANLVTVTAALLASVNPAMVTLAMTRPAAARHTRRGLEAGAPAFSAIQDSMAGYLDAESRLGRIPAGTDTATTALALVGTVHHLLMTSGPDGQPEPRQTVERLVTLLIAT